MENKIVLSKERMETINRWINLSAQNESLAIEVSPSWTAWVANPVLEHCLAPREARACLELLGIIVDHGIPASRVLIEISKEFMRVER
jgi:hypothetical protein